MKPKPVVVTTICSECGLPWENHGDNPTTSDCVRLLKAELARRPINNWYWYQSYPLQVTPTITWGTTYTNDQNCTINTPAIVNATCTAINVA